ncbi:MAG: hypothetical protein ACKVZ0_20080 [Gemmatimonadales bacterium]
MRRLATLAILAVTAGCAGSSVTGPNLDVRQLPATVTLEVGETATIGGVGARFSEVKGDSRCPEDVVCAWAGDAEVVLTVGPLTGEGPAQQLSLHTFLEPHAGTALGFVFTLVNLDPVPRSTDTKRVYRATIRVDRPAVP